MWVDIEPDDVLRVIQQFLKESNLVKTLQTMEEETGVSLNTVSNIDRFVAAVNNGDWDIVFETLRTLELPKKKFLDLYEQVILEYIELREYLRARRLLNQIEPMLHDERQYERHFHLENIIGQSRFDPREAYPRGSTKEKRRACIATSLSEEISVPSNRLLALLAEAARWQQHQGLLPPGTTFDLFRGEPVVYESYRIRFSKAFFRIIILICLCYFIYDANMHREKYISKN